MVIILASNKSRDALLKIIVIKKPYFMNIAVETNVDDVDDDDDDNHKYSFM